MVDIHDGGSIVEFGNEMHQLQHQNKTYRIGNQYVRIGVRTSLKITDRVGLVHQNEICKKIYEDFLVKTVMDLGAGNNPQKQVCNDLEIKQLLIDLGYAESDSENILRRSIDVLDFRKIQNQIFEFTGNARVDCVVSIGNIEHLERNDGEKLLDEVENWANKVVIFETPNGFVHQGPIDGNQHQIHLSGWTPSDFRKRGYKVYGTTGLKVLKKNSDKGEYKFSIKGMRFLDVFISRIFFLKFFPNLCFNFLAYKQINHI